MSGRLYRQAPADARSALTAAVAGVATGAVAGLTAWYFVRLWLRRERVDGAAGESGPRAPGAAGPPGIPERGSSEA